LIHLTKISVVKISDRDISTTDIGNTQAFPQRFHYHVSTTVRR